MALYSEDAAAEAEAFADALAAAGVLRKRVVYDGVPAGFFRRGEPAEAVADALRFMGVLQP